MPLPMCGAIAAGLRPRCTDSGSDFSDVEPAFAAVQGGFLSLAKTTLRGMGPSQSHLLFALKQAGSREARRRATVFSPMHLRLRSSGQSDRVTTAESHLCSRGDCTGKSARSSFWSLYNDPRNNPFHRWSCSYRLGACISSLVPWISPLSHLSRDAGGSTDSLYPEPIEAA